MVPSASKMPKALLLTALVFLVAIRLQTADAHALNCKKFRVLDATGDTPAEKCAESDIDRGCANDDGSLVQAACARQVFDAVDDDADDKLGRAEFETAAGFLGAAKRSATPLDFIGMDLDITGEVNILLNSCSDSRYQVLIVVYTYSQCAKSLYSSMLRPGSG
jgi:hypothetical protein